MPGHYEKEPSDKLKNITLDNLTHAQLKSAAGVVFIDSPSALADSVAVHNAKLSIATFGSTVIPSGGGIDQTTFSDAPPTGTQVSIPTGEVWLTHPSTWRIVNGSGSTNAVKVYLVDVANNVQNQIGTDTDVAGAAPDGAAVSGDVPPWLKLNSNLTLAVVGTGDGTLKIPYQQEAL